MLAEEVMDCDAPDSTSFDRLGPGWKMDPELELWVDVQRDPVNVRLAGVLDGRTGMNACAVVRQLIDEGYRHLTLNIEALKVDGAGGFNALHQIQDLIGRAGGELIWAESPWSSDVAGASPG